MIFAVDLWENAIFEHDTHYSKCPMFLEILNNGPIHQQFMRNTWADRFPRAPTAFDSASSSTSNSTTYSTPTGIVPMRMDSCAALRILKEIGVTPDLIYVDANHHYKPVLDDVSLSVELFPDALIVGDDWHYEEVQRAVREVGDKHGREVYVRGAHCWTYSKRECEAIFTSNWKSSQQAQQTTTPKNDEKKPKTTSTEKKPISLPANANFADLMKAYGSRN